MVYLPTNLPTKNQPNVGTYTIDGFPVDPPLASVIRSRHFYTALWQGINDYVMAPEFEDVWTKHEKLGRSQKSRWIKLVQEVKIWKSQKSPKNNMIMEKQP